MPAFADYVDLRLAVSDHVGNRDISDVMPRLTQAAESMLKDIKSFTDSVTSTSPISTAYVLLTYFPTELFTSGSEFAQHFAIIFSPISSEFDLNTKHPEAAHTLNNVHNYENAMAELQQSVAPELELIESRIVGPVKELQAVMKMIRKTIVKREHKVSDGQIRP